MSTSLLSRVFVALSLVAVASSEGYTMKVLSLPGRAVKDRLGSLCSIISTSYGLGKQVDAFILKASLGLVGGRGARETPVRGLIVVGVLLAVVF